MSKIRIRTAGGAVSQFRKRDSIWRWHLAEHVLSAAFNAFLLGSTLCLAATANTAAVEQTKSGEVEPSQTVHFVLRCELYVDGHAESQTQEIFTASSVSSQPRDAHLVSGNELYLGLTGLCIVGTNVSFRGWKHGEWSISLSSTSHPSDNAFLHRDLGPRSYTREVPPAKDRWLLPMTGEEALGAVEEFWRQGNVSYGYALTLMIVPDLSNRPKRVRIHGLTSVIF
jgi:hypothetical protein